MTRPPRRPPAARLPLHGRRQLRHLDPVRAARHRRRRACSATTSSRAGERAGHEVVGARARRARRHRRRGGRRRGRARPSPDAVVNCAAWTDVDGAESDPSRARSRSTAPAPATLARAAAAAGAPLVHVSTDYVFDGARRATSGRPRPTSSRDPTGPRSRLRRARSSPASARCSRPRRGTPSCAPSWLFGLGGRNFVATMLAPRRRARRGQGRRPTRSAARPGPGTSRRRCSGCSSAACAASSTSPAPGACSWHGFAARDLPPGRRRLPRAAARRPPRWRARRRGPPVGARDRARRRAAAAAVAGGPRGLPRGAGWDDAARMRAARLRRRRLHRLELRAPAPARARRRGVVLDKLTYAGREENLARHRRRARLPLRARRDRGPGGRRRRDRGLARRGDRQLRRRDPRRPLDRRARRVRATPTRSAPTCCSRRARAARAALRAGLHRRGLRLDRGGLVHRGEPARARPRPTPRPRPAPTCSCRATSTPTGWRRSICRGSNNYGPYQYPEKLIPLMVLNALHGDPLPVYGDGMQVRNWIHARTSRARSATCSSTARPARSTTPAAPTRWPNIEVVERIIELTGRRRVADRARHRPARPRPPLLALLGEGARARLGAAGALRGGARRDGRLVSRQRVVVGADPLRASTASTTSASTGARCRADAAPAALFGARRSSRLER